MSNEKDDKRELARAYRRAFEGKDGELILKDLAHFCHANRPTFDPGDDPNGRKHAFREGRREVWLRIQEALATTDADADR